MKPIQKYLLYFSLLTIVIFSGCLGAGSSDDVIYGFSSKGSSNFTFNVSGETPISNHVSLLCLANVSCIQNSITHTIAIDTIGGNGSKGDQGLNGTNGLNLTMLSVTDNGNYTYTWHYSDGNSSTTSNLQGASGSSGAPGLNGTNGGVNRSVREYHLGDGITFNYSTNFSIISGTSEIYLNGAKQNYNRIYTEGSNSINFTEVTIPDDWIEIKYETMN